MTTFADSTLSTIKPTFTANAYASTNSIAIQINNGIDIDHAAIISSDQSTWIGNMDGGYAEWNYVITGLKPCTTYNFWVKACSIDNGAYGPPENTTWQKVSVITTTAKLKAISSLPKSGMMCLTFDDGYSKTAIKTILNCLRQNKVNATFFIIGSCLKANPELWKQAIVDGNEICYHSMKHEKLTSYSDKNIIDDIAAWEKTAYKILGEDYVIPKLARFPGGNGNSSKRVLGIFRDLGYTVVAWNSDTYYDVIKNNKNATGKEIANYVINMANVGVISLQHFNSYDSKSVSLYIGTLLKSNKYTLGTVSKAIAAQQTAEALEAVPSTK